MSIWPVGISTGGYYRTSIFDCLEGIRDAGFNMIEVCSYPAHLDYHDLATVRRAAARIRELQLEPYSFHAPFADHIDITAPEEDARSLAVREIVQAAQSAAEIGAKYFVIQPGPERSPAVGDDKLRRMERAAETLNGLSCRCRELGIGLVLENMLPHLFFGHARDVLWFLGAIQCVDVGICLDTGHAFLSGDLSTMVHKLSGHLWMVHASDNFGERDDHCPPGAGRIPWPSFIEQLARMRFNGGVILEIAGGPDGRIDLAAACRARSFLHDLTDRTDLATRAQFT
jgi:sugar phosphate isomerase/epimerase